MLGLARFLLALCALALAALPASPAQAFCRETVEAESSGPCVEVPGVPVLHWTRGCMTYALNARMPARLTLMTEATIRSAFEESFLTWHDVDCGGSGEPFTVVQASGFTDTDRSEFLKDAPNESVISARTRDEWSRLDHDPNALAITLLWHDVQSGEILDVDMELNTGAGRFADCTVRRCGRDVMDLQNTVTHEAGHLLGLGHTPKADCDDCTMLADAPDGETDKRTLEQDDIAGYCALDLPSFDCSGGDCVCPAPEVFSSTRTITTCACSSVGAKARGESSGVAGMFALGAIFMLGAMTSRRVRRRCRHTP